jgi:hypothetical protein
MIYIIKLSLPKKILPGIKLLREWPVFTGIGIFILPYATVLPVYYQYFLDPFKGSG